jgi:hypothetical protein
MREFQAPLCLVIMKPVCVKYSSVLILPCIKYGPYYCIMLINYVTLIE